MRVFPLPPIYICLEKLSKVLPSADYSLILSLCVGRTFCLNGKSISPSTGLKED